MDDDDGWYEMVTHMYMNTMPFPANKLEGVAKIITYSCKTDVKKTYPEGL